MPHSRTAFLSRLELEQLEDRTLLSVFLVKDIAPGSDSSTPSSLTNVNGTLFFAAIDGAHGSTGTELWASDGTTAGTRLVKDIYPGPLSSNPSDLGNGNGLLYFSANDSTGQELWRSDGTAAGTFALSTTPPASGFVSLGAAVYYIAGSGTASHLWKTDGTPSGTTDTGIPADRVITLGNSLYLTSGATLYRSDGTPAGTTVVTTFPGPIAALETAGTHLYLQAPDTPASDGSQQTGLWQSDGIAAGTVKLNDWFTRPGGSFPGDPGVSVSVYHFEDVSGIIYFDLFHVLGREQYQRELWRTDGTPAGTFLLIATQANSNYDFGIDSELTDLNGTAYFRALAPNNRALGQLWRTDGTVAGTVAIGARATEISDLINEDGTMFFGATDGTYGEELWQSDGTAAGTVMTADINPGIPGSYPAELTNVAGNLFFSADDGTHGIELWEDRLTPLPPAIVPQTLTAASASGLAYGFVVTPGHALWHSSPSGWVKLGDGIASVSAITQASGTVAVVAVTLDQALFRYDDRSGWQIFGAPGTIVSARAGLDSSGQLAAFVLTTVNDLTEYRSSTGWLPSPIGGRGTILAYSPTTAADSVYVVTTDHSVFGYVAIAGWFRLTAAGFASSLAAVTDPTGHTTVFGTTLTGSLYRGDFATGWQKLGDNIGAIAAGTDVMQQAEVFALTTSGDFVDYTGASGWQLLGGQNSIDDFAAAGLGRTFAVTSDQSVFEYDPAAGWLRFTGSGYGVIAP